MISLQRAFLCVFSGAALAALSACSEEPQQRDRPPTAVGFITVAAKDIPITSSLPGRTVAFETSEVRPQITGLIRQRLFTEGSFVRAGQPLYQIDASVYQAAVNQAQANLASAKASAEAATARADRLRPLADMEAVSKQEYTDAVAQARVARASIAQAEAALELARINMRFTTIPAPISGRIGRSTYTVGALVSANQQDPLTTIQRLDPIYVDIQQSSAELTAMRQSLAKGDLRQGSTSVTLKLEDGSVYPMKGTIEFSEVVVNESTGNVTLRARFPNPTGLLLPGMFVRAEYERAIQPGALQIPQAAVQRDFDGTPFVYVVTKDNKAERRTIVADNMQGQDWVATSGVKAGDRVITQGASTVRHDMPVLATPATTAAQPAKGAPGKPGGPAGAPAAPAGAQGAPAPRTAG